MRRAAVRTKCLDEERLYGEEPNRGAEDACRAGHEVARLEAALAARDKTISVLREQLTAARRAGVAAASLFKGEKRVSITVAD